MKRLLLILFMIPAMMAYSQTFPGSFTQRANYPDTARYSVGYFTIGDTMYVLGGTDTVAQNKALWAYNTVANTWTRKNDPPFISRNLGRSIVVNGVAYFGLGFNGSNANLDDWWAYNAATDTWIQKNNFPGGTRYGSSTFSWNGKGYLIGGGAWDYTSGTAYKDVWEYNAATDTWTQQPDFAGTARGMTFCVVIGDTAYYGLGEEDSSHTYYNNMFKYNLVSKTWAPIASIPPTANVSSVDGIAPFAAVSGRKIILLNNDVYYTALSDLKTAYVYDIDSNTWTLYPMADTPGFRVMHAFSQIGDKAYIATGWDENADIWYTDCWRVNLQNFATGIAAANPDLAKISASSYRHTISIHVPASLLLKGGAEMLLYSVDGKLVRRFALGEDNRFDAPELPSAGYTYLIKCKDGGAKSGSLILY